jgi:mono/diheme cytochrome c family protein
VFLSDAPDGTLYIVDMYRGIIQQRADITEYLRDQILARKLEKPIGLGRIYRVMHDTTRRDSRPELSKASTSKLIDTLSSPNGWRRDTAQRLLVERADPSGVKALEKEAAGAKDWRTRVHALWTLDGIDGITPEVVARALSDASRDVRVSAVRLSERFAADAASPVRPALLKLIDDADWNVQQQLAASVGALPAGSRELAIAAVLEEHGDNPIVMDAALSGARGVELTVLGRIVQSTAQTPQRDAAVTMLAGTIVRGALDAGIQTLFQMMADDTRPAWQRSALLRGAEVALLGTTMPGTPPTRGRAAGPAANAPCPTCPGGRAGPGGSYAFAQVPATGRGNANARRNVRLNREPVALSTVAAGSGDLPSRAAAVIARVEWPGKPGMAAPIAPLSPDEEQRFNAGAEVYKNICITCHQPDGRGQEKTAASLIGSTLALAPPDVPARILLNGKEGPIGLMPPVGSVLSDDQIAAVLTYIRREWGQAGNAVDPAIVKDTRALVASRTKPWTNEELLALVGSGRGGGR